MFKEFPEDNKNDDFLSDFRQKIANQPMDNIEERRNELKRSKSVFLGAVSGVAMAAIVGWFVLGKHYNNGEGAEIPVIRRPQTVVKVQPADPGGMEIQNQDKSVYDIIEKKDDVKVVENLLPPPEEPRAVDFAEPIDMPPEVTPETIEVEEAKVVENIATVKPEPTPAPVPVAVPVVEEPKKIEEPAKVAPKPAFVIVDTEEDDKEVVVAPASKGIAVGSWGLQLMSSPNKKSVEDSWKTLSSKYKILAKHPYEVESADLGAKGTFYRLKVGAFKDRPGADSLCNDLKAMGGTCIVKKK